MLRSQLAEGSTEVPASSLIRTRSGCRDATRPASSLLAALLAIAIAVPGCGQGGPIPIERQGQQGPTALATTPYASSPIAIPGNIEAENFDNGGEGLAYHDTTAGNALGQYRATDVDVGVTADVGGGYSVGWTAPGEWLGYTVTVATAGPYSLAVRAATVSANQIVHLEVDGVDCTGPITLAVTPSWTTYATTRRKGISLPAGVHFVKLVFDTGSVDLNYLKFTNDTPAFSGAPAAVPGTIQAENFDNGGEGVAYHDTTRGNALGQFRTTDVDVGVTADVGGGYSVGWTDPGEWLGYTIAVASSGRYAVGIRAATAIANQRLHLEVDGVDVTGPIVLTATPDWTTYATTMKAGVQLSSGTHFLKLVFDTGSVDLNYLTIAEEISVPPPPPPVATATPFSGVPAAVPGTIEAENFDNGGEGVAYHDTTGGNALGQFRATDVDVGVTTDVGGGFSVGWTDPGEWLGYTIAVASSGGYAVGIRAATPIANQRVHLEVDGVDVTGPIALTTTPDWTTYATSTRAGVQLSSGTHFIKLVFDTGSVDLNYLTIADETAAPPPNPVVTGPQLYVAPTGDDSNPGTLAQPWRTIQKAMNSAAPGSTVNIRGGTYHERLSVNVSGTAGNYVTFQPYGFSVPPGGCGGYTGVSCGGEQVILDYAYLGTVSDGIAFLLVSGRSYLRIQGITFQNFTTYELNFILNYGVRVDGASNYVEFKYNRFLNNKDTAPWNGTSAFAHIRVWGPSSNVWFYGNEIGWIVSNYSEALTADGPTQSYFVAENNWMHDTDALGIDLHGGAHHYVVRANKFEYISKRRDGTFWYGNPSVPIYNDGGNNGLIERNDISDSGVGIEALSEPGQPATHDIVIRDNLVRRSLTGIVIGTWHSNTDGSSVYNVRVFNNTFHANGTAVVIRPMISSTVAWKNNIFANNGTSYVNTLGWDPGAADYNLYFGGGAGPDAHKLMADPLFVNPGAGDFGLQPGSPAIGAGDPGTTANDVGPVDFAGAARMANGRIDAGALEAQ